MMSCITGMLRTRKDYVDQANGLASSSERRQIGWMKDAMTPRLANLLGQAYHASGTTDDMRAKVDKVCIDVVS